MPVDDSAQSYHDLELKSTLQSNFGTGFWKKEPAGSEIRPLSGGPRFREQLSGGHDHVFK
jgi:hypothetical protein